MTTNLARSGFQVLIYDRTRRSSLPDGVTGVETSAAAAGLAVTMVSDDAALEAVSRGADGVLAGMPKGGLRVSMSTISPRGSGELAARHAERGQHYVAATVFGRPDVTDQRGVAQLLLGPTLGARLAVALLIIGFGLLNVADAPWAHAIGVVGLLGFILMAFAALVPRALAEDT